MLATRAPRLLARRVALTALVTGAVAASAPASFAPGLTYRARISQSLPDMPGMPPQEPVLIVGHGSAIGRDSRFDIDSVNGPPQITATMPVGTYMLMLDSGKVLTIDPAAKTWTDAASGLSGMPPEVLAQASFTNVTSTAEKLGPGESIQGYPTEKVRITTSYTLSLMGTVLATTATEDMWVAQLPASAMTPFSGAIPAALANGPMKELAEKEAEARKSLGTGTPLKTVITSSISGPVSITTSVTVELLDLKPTEVDPTALKVPEGFTKKP